MNKHDIIRELSLASRDLITVDQEVRLFTVKSLLSAKEDLELACYDMRDHDLHG